MFFPNFMEIQYMECSHKGKIQNILSLILLPLLPFTNFLNFVMCYAKRHLFLVISRGRIISPETDEETKAKRGQKLFPRF